MGTKGRRRPGRFTGRPEGSDAGMEPERRRAQEAENEVIARRRAVKDDEIHRLLRGVPPEGPLPQDKGPGKGGEDDEERDGKRRKRPAARRGTTTKAMMRPIEPNRSRP